MEYKVHSHARGTPEALTSFSLTGDSLVLFLFSLTIRTGNMGKLVMSHKYYYVKLWIYLRTAYR